MQPDELEVRLRMLELAVRVQDCISFAIAISLSPEEHPKLLNALQVVQVNASAKDGSDVAGAMQHFIDRLRAVSAPGASSPLLALTVEAALYAKTRPDLRESLQYWLTIATAGELADDVREVLPPTPQKRAARGKRGKGESS